MSTRRLTMMLIAAAAFAFGILSTLRSAPAEERFDYKVRADFFAGFRGDTAGLDRAMKACEDALATDPKHAEALVWHGSGLYFRGGQAFMSGDAEKGMDLVTRGIQEMDDAVAMQPDRVAVRIPRGAILLESTLFMDENPIKEGLIQRGLEDYQKAYQIQEKSLDKLGTHPRGELLFGIADANRRLGHEQEAKTWFDRVAKEMAGTEYAKRASAYLTTGTLNREQETCFGCHTGK